MPKIAVVVLNWNRKKDTLECLKSLDQIKAKTFHLDVVVVDNGSTDGSVTAIKNYKVKNFKKHLVELGQNLGFAGGNNAGVSYALSLNSDFVMVLNNDTIIDASCITALLTGAKRHPKAAILSPKIYFAHGFEFHKKRYKSDELGKVIWYAGGQMDWNNVYGSNYGVDEVDKGQFNEERKIDFATGACFLARTEALKKTGLFDERYYLYLEDAELSQRVKAKGFEIWYIPGGVIWHKVSQSSGVGSDLNDYYITRNRLLFGMAYAPIRAKIALIRESFWLAQNGRKWQKIGARDFYLRKFGRGSWK